MPEQVAEESVQADSSPTARELPAAVAALAIIAYFHPNGRASDIDDNEADRQNDGSVRLSLRVKGAGHERIFVTIPETITLQIAPEKDLE